MIAKENFPLSRAVIGQAICHSVIKCPDVLCETRGYTEVIDEPFPSYQKEGKKKELQQKLIHMHVMTGIWSMGRHVIFGLIGDYLLYFGILWILNKYKVYTSSIIYIFIIKWEKCFCVWKQNCMHWYC